MRCLARYAARARNEEAGSSSSRRQFAGRPVQCYGPCVLRRVVSAVALLVLALAPMAARTRLFCRYTGLEITDCAQQEIPGSTVVQVAGCCDRQVTRPLGVTRIAQQQQIAP